MINMPAGPEIMVILLLALLVLGPDQLPKAMRSFGNVMSEIRKVSSSFQAEMRDALEVMEDGIVPAEGREKRSGATTSSEASEASESPGPDADAATKTEGEGADGGTVEPSDGAGVGGDPAGSRDAETASTDRPGRDGGIGTNSAAGDRDSAVRPVIDPADRAAG